MADQSTLREDALQFHVGGRRHGKIEVNATKKSSTQRDLSLAYSPGVAYPCLEIEKDPATAYDYTAKGNFVAVISNGTAVLGLGNIGALASKPVWKVNRPLRRRGCRWHRHRSGDRGRRQVRSLRQTDRQQLWRHQSRRHQSARMFSDRGTPQGGTRRTGLPRRPAWYRDHHRGGLHQRALHLTGRDITDTRVVVNGAGASAIACVDLIKKMGMPNENVTLCDSRGVIYRGREDGMNQWKSAYVVETNARDLEQALKGADVFIGLSTKDVVSQDMVKSMAEKPIIFAMANPDPEITPEHVKAVRDDAIVATGRSDYPNQVNNVLGFPYIFRGALDVHASRINDEMKIAAAEALAALAREDVPEEVAAAYGGQQLHYGNEYIIPVPFDPRLIAVVPAAVAQAAMDTGVAQRPVEDMEAYRRELSARLDPTSSSLQLIHDKVRNDPRRGFCGGRGRSRDLRCGPIQECRLRRADPDRTRGRSAAHHGGTRLRQYFARGPQCPPQRTQSDLHQFSLQSAPARRLPRTRLSAPSESRPQYLRRVHGRERRCRRHDHRRHTGL